MRLKLRGMQAASRPTCPHCAAPLSALALRNAASHCGAARCRHAAEQRLAAARRQALVEDLVATLPDGPAPLVVWLQHHDPQTVAVSAADRARHRAHLERVLAENVVIDYDTLATPSADDSRPQGAQLCSHCRGRCCAHGAAWHAFIDLPLLQRWQQAHPGQSLDDAVEAYLSLLPPEHSEHGCVYQTAQGCVVPRELRADICNSFACAPLQQVQASAVADSQRPVLALGVGEHTIERVALITAQGMQALSLPPPAPA